MSPYFVIATALAVAMWGRPSLAQPFATIACSPKTGTLTVQYIFGSDDGSNNLSEFPRSCKLGSARYRIRALRGPYTQSRCGGQPPVFIWLTRNSAPLVSDAAFGDNCHGGPAIVELRVQESTGRLGAMEVCIAPTFPAEQAEMKCRAVPADRLTALPDEPISQGNLDEYLRSK